MPDSREDFAAWAQAFAQAKRGEYDEAIQCLVGAQKPGERLERVLQSLGVSGKLDEASLLWDAAEGHSDTKDLLGGILRRNPYCVTTLVEGYTMRGEYDKAARISGLAEFHQLFGDSFDTAGERSRKPDVPTSSLDELSHYGEHPDLPALERDATKGNQGKINGGDPPGRGLI